MVLHVSIIGMRGPVVEWIIWLGQGQQHVSRAANARLALDSQGAAMRGDDVLANGKPYA